MIYHILTRSSQKKAIHLISYCKSLLLCAEQYAILGFCYIQKPKAELADDISICLSGRGYTYQLVPAAFQMGGALFVLYNAFKE